MQIVWAIIVGAIAGFIARWISPSPNNSQGFVLTTVLGIVGSVVATFLGRAIHLYGPGQGAGIIASIIGALIVLWGWHPVVIAEHRPGGIGGNLADGHLLPQGRRRKANWLVRRQIVGNVANDEFASKASLYR